MKLFLHCFAKGHAALQTISLQIITDILSTHSFLLAPTTTASGDDQASSTVEPSDFLRPVLKVFAKSLKSADSDVQAMGVNALSKLMLSQMITDTDLLKLLVISFFDPETAENAQLRQSLSYFLPVYCHSRGANAERMAMVATGVVARLTTLREALMDDEDVEEGEMVTLATVGGLLVDWTDPRKIIGNGFDDDRAARHKTEQGTAMASSIDMTHFVLAEQILERLVTSQTSSEYHPGHHPMQHHLTIPAEEERKVLFSMLSKLHLNVPNPEPELLRTTLELVAETIDTKVASDATSRNVVSKLQTSLLKLMHDIATAERGGEETVLEDTVLPGREANMTVQSTTGAVEEDEEEEEEEKEDEVTAQLRREMEATRLEVPDAESTQLDDSVQEYDFSGMADDKDIQELLDSMVDEDDEDLID